MFSSFVSLFAKLAYFVFKKRVQLFPLFHCFSSYLISSNLLHSRYLLFFKSQKVLVKISMLGTYCITLRIEKSDDIMVIILILISLTYPVILVLLKLEKI